MSTISLKHRRGGGGAAADYLKLVTLFPLRSIGTAADYAKAAALVDLLAVREDLTPGEADYLDALTVFIEAYDDEHEPDPVEGIGPVEILKALMEHRGMSSRELGDLLGSKGAASEILHGKRGISKMHMAKLSAHFGVDAGVFLEKRRTDQD